MCLRRPSDSDRVGGSCALLPGEVFLPKCPSRRQRVRHVFPRSRRCNARTQPCFCGASGMHTVIWASDDAAGRGNSCSSSPSRHPIERIHLQVALSCSRLDEKWLAKTETGNTRTRGCSGKESISDDKNALLATLGDGDPLWRNRDHSSKRAGSIIGDGVLGAAGEDGDGVQRRPQSTSYCFGFVWTAARRGSERWGTSYER